jgi:hypothetical protein
MKTIKTLILLGTVALSGSALAQMMQPGQMLPDKRADVAAQVKAHFTMMDANHDGAITREEMAAMHEKHMAAMRDQHFNAMDANKDGSISRAEFDAGHQMKKGEHETMGGGMTGGGMAGGGMAGSDKGDGEHGDHQMKMEHDGKPMMGGGMMLDMADANKDGKLTEAELITTALAKFDKADANHDGVLSQAERMSAHRMMSEGRRDGKGVKRR